MTEDDARRWFADRFDAARCEKVATFLEMVTQENQNQNLLSPASLPTIWARHAVDSAQLLPLASALPGWMDIGTGGGFPGMVVGLLRDDRVTLVEPRKRRAAFLAQCVSLLDAAAVSVVATKVEQVDVVAGTISARAVATVEKLLQASAHCATSGTRWIMPRGQSALEDLPTLARRFGVMFHVEHSVTDPSSVILIAERR